MHMRSSPYGENAEQTQGLIGEKSIAIQYEESTPLNEELFSQQVPVLLTKNPLNSSDHEIKKTIQETSTLTFNQSPVPLPSDLDLDAGHSKFL